MHEYQPWYEILGWIKDQDFLQFYYHDVSCSKEPRLLIRNQTDHIDHSYSKPISTVNLDSMVQSYNCMLEILFHGLTWEDIDPGVEQIHRTSQNKKECGLMGGWDKDDVETSQTTWPVGSSIKFRICYTTKERDTYRKYCPFSLCFYSNSYKLIIMF
jgi:hypothetical protein